MNKEDLKYLLRSGSLAFARDRTRRGAAPASYLYRGKPVFYRPGTSDVSGIYSILLKQGPRNEYHIPYPLEPATILDIGANIGATSILLANRFPRARIYAFEPMPENFELLRRNTAGYPGVTPLNVALGERDERRALRYSDNPSNFGGFSFHARGVDASGRSVTVEVRNAGTMLAELGIASVDLIKIDTEGSEYAIVRALPRDILARVQWICGELHGEHDFALLEYLSEWFDIGAKRTIGKRLFMFYGLNRSLTP